MGNRVTRVPAPDRQRHVNALSTVRRLARLSATPVWATFLVAPAAAMASTLQICITPWLLADYASVFLLLRHRYRVLEQDAGLLGNAPVDRAHAIAGAWSMPLRLDCVTASVI